MSKRGLKEIPIQNRDYDPSFLKGNPSNRVGFLGVEVPQRAIACMIGVVACLGIVGYFLS